MLLKPMPRRSLYMQEWIYARPPPNDAIQFVIQKGKLFSECEVLLWDMYNSRCLVGRKT